MFGKQAPKAVSGLLAFALVASMCPAAGLAYAAEGEAQSSASTDTSASNTDRINEDVSLDASDSTSGDDASDAADTVSSDASSSGDSKADNGEEGAGASGPDASSKYTGSSNGQTSADVSLNGAATVGTIEYNGLAYTINEDDDATVSVTGVASSKPTGDVQIPAQIANGGKLYAVTGIKVVGLPEDANPYANDLFNADAKALAVKTISIPSAVSTINPAFFQLFPNATDIAVASENPTYTSYDGALYSADLTQLILVPQGKGSLVLPRSLVNVPAYVFSQCNKLSAMSFPGSTSGDFLAVQNNVLYTNDLSTLLAAPAGLGASASIAAECVTIAEGAFYGSAALDTIVVNGVVEGIAAAGDNALGSDGQPLMGGSAVSGSTLPAFESAAVENATVVINVAAETDGDEAAALIERAKAAWEAYGFTKFKEPAAPGTEIVPEQGSGFAFTLLADYTLSVRWAGATEPPAAIDIPDYGIIDGVQYTVSTIADNGFSNYTSLVTVDIPQTVAVIGDSAFELCTSLQTVHFDSVVSIGTKAFANTALLSLVLPTTVQSIGDNAFSNMKGTTVVALGSIAYNSPIALGAASGLSVYVPYGTEDAWDAGIPTLGNHIYPYGVKLSDTPLELEVGQTANIADNGYIEAPGDVEASYAYKANPISLNTEDGTVEAKQAGSTYISVSLQLTIDQVAVKENISNVIKLKPIAADGEEESNIVAVPQTISLASDIVGAIAYTATVLEQSDQIRSAAAVVEGTAKVVEAKGAVIDMTCPLDAHINNRLITGTYNGTVSWASGKDIPDDDELITVHIEKHNQLSNYPLSERGSWMTPAAGDSTKENKLVGVRVKSTGSIIDWQALIAGEPFDFVIKGSDLNKQFVIAPYRYGTGDCVLPDICIGPDTRDLLEAVTIEVSKGDASTRYIYSYDANGGTFSNGAVVQAVASTGGWSAPADPTRSGYDFAGWYYDADCTSKVGTTDTLPQTSQTFYAKWEPSTINPPSQVTITWRNNNDAGYQTTVQQAGEKLRLPETPAGNGFQGWFTKSSGGDKVTEGAALPKGNAVYYAQWSPSIVYAKNAVIDITANSGNRIITGTYDGYVSWESGKSVPDDDELVTVNITKHDQLSAYTWANSERNLNSGQGDVTGKKIVGVRVGDAGSVIDWTAVKEGRPFSFVVKGAWLQKSFAISPYRYGDGECVLPNICSKAANKTDVQPVYAEVADGDTTSHYIYTYDANGGSFSDGTVMQAVATTGAWSAPADPTRSGYDFAGWYYDADCTGKVAITNSLPQTSQVFYAKWDPSATNPPSQVTITWRNNNDNGYQTTTQRAGEKLRLPETPAGNGFQGWFTKPSGGDKVTEGAALPKGDTVYYAQWSPAYVVAKNAVIDITANNGGRIITGTYDGYVSWESGKSVPDDDELVTVNVTKHDQLSTYTWTNAENNLNTYQGDVTGKKIVGVRVGDAGSVIDWTAVKEGRPFSFVVKGAWLQKKFVIEGFRYGNGECVLPNICSQWLNKSDVQPVYAEVADGDTAPRYIHTYDANGGSFSDGTAVQAVVTTGAWVGSTGEPVRLGYDFAGWCWDAECRNMVGETGSLPRISQTFYAKWIGKAYTVNFDANAGDDSSVQLSASSVEARYGDNVSFPTGTRKSYYLKWWNTEPDGTGERYEPGSTTGIAPNFATGEDGDTECTLYAQWYHISSEDVPLNVGQSTVRNASNAAMDLCAKNGTRFLIGSYNGSMSWNSTAEFPEDDDIVTVEVDSVEFMNGYGPSDIVGRWPAPEGKRLVGFQIPSTGSVVKWDDMSAGRPFSFVCKGSDMAKNWTTVPTHFGTGAVVPPNINLSSSAMITPVFDDIEPAAGASGVLSIFDANGGYFEDGMLIKTTYSPYNSDDKATLVNVYYDLVLPDLSEVNIVRDGNYEFVGWYFDKEGNSPLGNPARSAAIGSTYYAKWMPTGQNSKVKLTWYNNNGGEEYRVTSQSAGEKLHVPVAPNGTGFQGWFTKPSGGTKVEEGAALPQGDTAYYAQWSPSRVTAKNATIDIQSYNYRRIMIGNYDGVVTWDSGKSVPEDDELVTFNITRYVPMSGYEPDYPETWIPVPDGMKYIGWEIPSTGSVIYWDRVKAGEPFSFTCKGSDLCKVWTTGPLWFGNGECVLPNFNISLQSNLVPAYTSIEATEIMNTFDANGGTFESGATFQMVLSDLSASPLVLNKPETDPTREGYTFDGWYSDKNLTSPAPSCPSLEERTFYAKWSPVGQQARVKLTWDENNGSGNYQTTYQNAGEGLAMPDDPVSTNGSDFVGWFTKPSGGDQLNAGDALPIGDTVYYAHWSPAVVVAKDAIIDLCGFRGWRFITGTYDGTMRWDSGNAIPDDDEIVSVNVTKQVQLTGYDYDSRAAAYGENEEQTIIGWRLPSTGSIIDWSLVKAGKPFSFTCKGSDLKKVFTTGAYWYGQGECLPPNINIHLDSGFEPVFTTADSSSVLVTFDANGGAFDGGSSTQVVVSPTSAIETPASPHRTGYTFDGWFADRAGLTPMPARPNASGNTFYAKWNVNTYTIKFDGNADSDASLELSAASTKAMYDQPVVFPDAKRTGYILRGWTTNADGTGRKFEPNMQSAAPPNLATGADGDTEATVYAYWVLDINVQVPLEMASNEGVAFNVDISTGDIEATGGDAAVTREVMSFMPVDAVITEISFDTKDDNGNAFITDSVSDADKWRELSEYIGVTLKPDGKGMHTIYSDEPLMRSEDFKVAAANSLADPGRLKILYGLDLDRLSSHLGGNLNSIPLTGDDIKIMIGKVVYTIDVSEYN